jgi:hypothetical protein
MDLGNEAAGKLYNCGAAIIRVDWFDQNRDAVVAGLGERFAKIAHFIAVDFISKRIGKLAIGCHELHLAELRFEANAPISLARLADFRGVRVPVIGNHPAAGKVYERMRKIIDAVRRHIDAILRYESERFVRRGHEVPVELHFYAAGPLYDRIHSDRVLEWFDQDAGARCARGRHRLIHVRDQVAGTLQTERIRYRG